MALTDEQVRKIYKYLRVPQITQHGSVLSGTPVLTAFVHVVQTAVNQLTIAGEASVVSILSTMDAIRTAMASPTAAFGLKRVKGGSSEIEYQDNDGGFQQRNSQWEYWRNELASVLGLSLWQLDLPSGGAREP